MTITHSPPSHSEVVPTQPLIAPIHEKSHLFARPRDYTGESVIVMQGQQDELEKVFGSVEKVARVDHPYSTPYEHFDVFYGRNVKFPLKDAWPKVKNWN